MGACSTVLIILITLLFPPIGVYLVAGCGADLLINIALTIFGYIPGHVHAFYLEYVYFTHQERKRDGISFKRAPGVYSERVQNGGRSYGTMG